MKEISIKVDGAIGREGEFSAEDSNNMYNELMGGIKAAGMVADEYDSNQLIKSIMKLAHDNSHLDISDEVNKIVLVTNSQLKDNVGEKIEILKDNAEVYFVANNTNTDDVYIDIGNEIRGVQCIHNNDILPADFIKVGELYLAVYKRALDKCVIIPMGEDRLKAVYSSGNKKTIISPNSIEFMDGEKSTTLELGEFGLSTGGKSSFIPQPNLYTNTKKWLWNDETADGVLVENRLPFRWSAYPIGDSTLDYKCMTIDINDTDKLDELGIPYHQYTVDSGGNDVKILYVELTHDEVDNYSVFLANVGGRNIMWDFGDYNVSHIIDVALLDVSGDIWFEMTNKFASIKVNDGIIGEWTTLMNERTGLGGGPQGYVHGTGTIKFAIALPYAYIGNLPIGHRPWAGSVIGNGFNSYINDDVETSQPWCGLIGPVDWIDRYMNKWDRGINFYPDYFDKMPYDGDGYKAIKILKTGMYELEYRQRGDNNRYGCVVVNSDRSILEDSEYGIWTHDHTGNDSDVKMLHSVSKYIGKLSAGMIVTGGWNDDEGQYESIKGTDGILIIKRIGN